MVQSDVSRFMSIFHSPIFDANLRQFRLQMLLSSVLFPFSFFFTLSNDFFNISLGLFYSSHRVRNLFEYRFPVNWVKYLMYNYCEGNTALERGWGMDINVAMHMTYCDFVMRRPLRSLDCFRRVGSGILSFVRWSLEHDGAHCFGCSHRTVNETTLEWRTKVLAKVENFAVSMILRWSGKLRRSKLEPVRFWAKRKLEDERV